INLFEACSAVTSVTACMVAKFLFQNLLLQRLQPLRCLHDYSSCFRPERKWPDGIRTRWTNSAFARRTGI
ncbi:MAG: hypothetical protein COZ24_08020, partial [Hydrogenophilales bacterium CG_4_10_14_3_um_filter_63_21]